MKSCIFFVPSLLLMLLLWEASSAPYSPYGGYPAGKSQQFPYMPGYYDYPTNNDFPRQQLPPSSYADHSHHGVLLASWKWTDVGVHITLTVFIVITGLAKVAFHHAHWLSSRVPESCLMIIVGVAVGAVLFICDWGTPKCSIVFPKFSTELFFLVLLPPVILESAYSLYDRSFFDNLSTILVYAVVGTLFNTFMIGPLLYLLSMVGAIVLENLKMSNAIVFSALISAVDPVAVLAIFQEVGVNKDLYYMLFGESLLNDAVTVVLYESTVIFTSMTHVDPSQCGLAVVAFFTTSLGGLLIGIIFGLLTALLTKTTQDVRVVEPLAILGIAYLSYVAAQVVGWSGIISIIGCGLVQAHYALKNISDNSRTTVVYFTKMVSSTSEAIIFFFLGIVLVNKNHIWNTGFVLSATALCLVCRFIGVFSLTAILNRYRVKKIDFQEQFIMAYGGLRGAVAFSLAKMLEKERDTPTNVFMTTTLVIILFTVFIQGGTIKIFVNLLNIEKSGSDHETMLTEINDNIIDTMMAGIEEITGIRGDNYLRRKIEFYDQHYLTKIFLNTTKSNSLTRLYEKLSLTQHFAHLYGPVALIEDKRTVLLHDAAKKKLPRSASARGPAQRRVQDLFPGVQLRRRTLSDTNKPDPNQLEQEAIRTSTEQLRKAFRQNPYQKYHERYDRNILYDQLDMENMLQRRVTMARRITHGAALAYRSSASPTTEESSMFGEFEKPLRKIHSELEGIYPEDVEGIDALLERANRRRVARHSSTAGSYQSSSCEPSSLLSTDSASPLPASVRRALSLAPRAQRVRKISGGIAPHPEAQSLIGHLRGASQDNVAETVAEETGDDESKL